MTLASSRGDPETENTVGSELLTRVLLVLIQRIERFRYITIE